MNFASMIVKVTRVAEWGVHVLIFLVMALLLIGMSTTDYSAALLPLAVVTFCQILAFAFCYVLNDLTDLREDRLQGKVRPIQSWSKTAVVLLLLLTGPLSLVVLFIATRRLDVLSIGLVQFVLGMGYSMRPLRFKERGLAGLITAAVSQRIPPLLILAMLIPHPAQVVWYLAIWLTFLGLMFITEHQMEDRDADARTGVRTFATVNGERTTAIVRLASFAGFSASAALAPLHLFPGRSHGSTLFPSGIVVLSAAIVILMRYRYRQSPLFELNGSATSSPAINRFPKSDRVTIIGAGLAGLTAAIKLAEQGIAVQVVDANAGFDNGAPLPKYHSSDTPGRTPRRRGSSIQCVRLNVDATSAFLGIGLAGAFSRVESEATYLYARKAVTRKKDRFACERGRAKTSLDYLLYKCARDLEVEFRFHHPVGERISSDTTTIIATGLDPNWYERLQIPYAKVMGFEAFGDWPGPNVLISVRDSFTKGDFAYIAAKDGHVYSLLFSRDYLGNEDLQQYRNFVKNTEGISFDHWFAMKGCVGTELYPFRDDKILAGTLAGMIDPFYLGGISPALISGRIAALWVTDPTAAKREYGRLRGHLKPKRWLWNMASRHYASKSTNVICIFANAMLKDVWKL